MKNAWKGLVVGALTGMLGGAALDRLMRAGHAAADTVGRAKEHVKETVPAAARAAGHEAASTGTAVARRVNSGADHVVAGTNR